MKKFQLGWAITLIGILSVLSFACQKEVQEKASSEPLQEETADGKFPYKRLSTYGFFQGELNALQPISEVILYEPASSLFTDYALKTRFIYFPKGEKASIADDEFTFPEGTVIIKNFYFPQDYRKPGGERRIIETRLLINGQNGWDAYPYIWNDSQTEALLKVVGGEVEVKFTDLKDEDQVINYLVPNKNQCKTCHNKSEVLVPIGVKVKHLNNEIAYSEGKENQLSHWTELGKLEGFMGKDAHPSMIDYSNESLPLNDRAMAYLDINCSHCHNADGPASTSGLFLTYDQRDPMKLGINKTPVAAGNGAGSFNFDIAPGEADQSILTHRMNSTEVGVAMPELGRTTIHKEGVQLIRDWINSMPK